MGLGRASAGMQRDELVRVLLVEDSPDHAELIFTKLRRSKRIRADIDHADRLEKGLEGLDWPSGTMTAQESWIGKSKGTEIDFKIDGLKDEVREAAIVVLVML